MVRTVNSFEFISPPSGPACYLKDPPPASQKQIHWQSSHQTQMFKKLFSSLVGSREEYSFVRDVSAEITKLRHESAAFMIHEADQRTFSMATKTLTRLVAGGGVPPELKHSPPRTIAWTLIDKMILQIGVGDDPSRTASEKFYRFFENDKLKEIEAVYGPSSGWGKPSHP